MSDYVPPCRSKANDPEDWFIGRDGKQYPDDVVLTLEEAEVLTAGRGLDPDDASAVAEVFEEVHAERIKAQLRKRRHAKDRCFTECKMRLECLGLALRIEEGPLPANLIEYGTFGGYFEEERKQIVAAALARQNRSSA